jgi:hypothetical protein
MLYIDANKTADIAKSGPEKCNVAPWIFDAPLHQNVFYWLEKLLLPNHLSASLRPRLYFAQALTGVFGHLPVYLAKNKNNINYRVQVSYSTVTLFARLRGLSTSQPSLTAR